MWWRGLEQGVEYRTGNGEAFRDVSNRWRERERERRRRRRRRSREEAQLGSGIGQASGGKMEALGDKRDSSDPHRLSCPVTAQSF